jgi:hypothetical protein
MVIIEDGSFHILLVSDFNSIACLIHSGDHGSTISFKFLPQISKLSCCIPLFLPFLQLSRRFPGIGYPQRQLLQLMIQGLFDKVLLQNLLPYSTFGKQLLDDPGWPPQRADALLQILVPS